MTNEITRQQSAPDVVSPPVRLRDISQGTGPKGRKRLTLLEVSAAHVLPAWTDDEQGRIKRDAM